MITLTEFSGTKTEYLFQDTDYLTAINRLETDYFEVRLTTRSDLDCALSAGCKIYCREIKSEDTVRNIYFIRVPKANLFQYAVHHGE